MIFQRRAMAAYVIAEIEVTDPAAYAEYGKQVPATIEKYGGRFIVRGGALEPLEGGWSPKRLVVLEFPSMAQARAWYRSAEYAPLIRLRQKASRGKLIAVEGS
jgi:uncharacterized protein (DUF1330 family)